jgi:hypothetical protein
MNQVETWYNNIMENVCQTEGKHGVGETESPAVMVKKRDVSEVKDP